jgi:hypothetical protein
MRVAHRATGLAEQWRRRVKGDQYPSFQGFRHDLAARGVLVRFGQPVGLVVLRYLVAVEQAGEHRSVSVLGQLVRRVKVPLRVVESRHQRPPVEDGAVLSAVGRAHDLEGLGGHTQWVRLDVLVVDAR